MSLEFINKWLKIDEELIRLKMTQHNSYIFTINNAVIYISINITQ